MAARIHIRVIPNASRTEMVGPYREGWKVKVQTPPEGGRANKAVVDCLANALGIPKRSITLESGDKSRDKIFRIDAMNEQEIVERLSH
jgi:hypothetical protein